MPVLVAPEQLRMLQHALPSALAPQAATRSRRRAGLPRSATSAAADHQASQQVWWESSGTPEIHPDVEAKSIEGETDSQCDAAVA